jgi:ParB family transcriptional regulator, chromosome partitioning protein
MSKKKRFGISEALTRGLSETINVVENNAGVFRNVVLPLSRIELDPDNPRKLAIDLEDVRQGIRPDDNEYERKQDDLNKLKELAHTIKTSGIINPVVVYKRGEYYRLVAGERRSLASILAGKQEIEARVFNEKPKSFDLKLIQWVENTAREDLTLEERLGNVSEIIHEYKLQHEGVDMTATVLRDITGLSLSQTTYYLAALNAPEDVRSEIKNGTIRNLDKAALLAGVQSAELRRNVLDACVQGSSLKEMRAMISQQKQITTKARTPIKLVTRGRQATRVNMGTTESSAVVKRIVECVLDQDRYGKYADVFTRVNWDDLKQTTKAFRKLIELLELEMAV